MGLAAFPLQQPTLVLNKSWTPIFTVPAKRAIIWLYRNVVCAVDERSYTIHDFTSWVEVSEFSQRAKVSTPSITFGVPEVVKMVSYNGVPQGRIPFTRKALFKRDKFTCQYCGATPGSKELTIDHVLAVSRGGKSNWENCVLACVKCNSRKGSKTPKECGYKLLKKPGVPKWSPLHNLSSKTVLESWQNFISEAYWNTLIEE